jgi:hypothetical protein
MNSKYSGSTSLLLSEVYPEYDWLPWKFVNTPHNIWEDMKNQRKFMDWASKELNVNNISDWYNVSPQVTIATKSFSKN